MRTILLFTLVILPGCGMIEHYVGEATPRQESIAVAWRSPTIDGHRIRRVIALPFRDDTDYPGLSDGIQSGFVDALNNRQAFEVVSLGREVLTDSDEELWFRTGRVRKDTIITLSRTYHADAVLYGTVTRYRAYEPMAVGLRISLVSSGAGDPVWEANALFDTADARIVRDVHNWWNREAADIGQLENWRTVLMSPTLFITYACTRVVETW